MMRALMLLACLSPVVVGAAVTPNTLDPARAERLQAYLRQVRCLVCQNETLADSGAELAADLRREIREQMEAGRSDEEITAFLRERYGDFVLYRPPVKPATYPLWFGPFILLVGGALGLYRRVSAGHAQTTPPDSVARKRARRLLRPVTGEDGR